MFAPNIKIRLALFLLLAALLVASVGLKQRDAVASVEKTHPTKGKATRTKQATDRLARKHSFSGKAPLGTWSVSAIPDLNQATDTDTPVVVSGLSSLFGKKEWGGFLKVVAVKLNNRSPAAVAGVRLGWVIVTEQDRVALKSDAEAKKAEGATPFFETPLAAYGAKKLDSPVIDFLAEAKPLLKKGRLRGDFVIKVRVIEVEFADGSLWQEQESSAKADENNRALSRNYNPLYEPMMACDNTKCISEHNNGILDQCAPDPFPGLFCRINTDSCTPDGSQCVCNNNVCANCYDDDGDDVTTCEGDCNDNNYNISPLAPENCTNTVDDNCNGLIDRYDTY
jgi:hypothetical protein